MMRPILFAAGWSSVGLAIAGAFLPLLPCTPFVLLAAVCFARSSPSTMQRLRCSPFLGTLLRDWERQRGMRPSAKVTAACLAICAPLLTWAVSPQVGIPLGISIIGGAIALVVIGRLPTIRSETSVVPPPNEKPARVRSKSASYVP